MLKKEIVAIYNAFLQKATRLKKYSYVSIPKLFNDQGKYTTTGLSMVFFFMNLGKIVHKQDLITFLRKHGLCRLNPPNPRHFGMQNGFYFLVRDCLHPRTKRLLKPGEYCLYTLNRPHPTKHNDLSHKDHHRSVRLTSDNFECIKQTHDHHCAVCGSIEGQHHLKNRALITKLERGHCDPRKPLDSNNCIPICTYCNQIYKDYFVFNKRGIIVRVIHGPKVYRLRGTRPSGDSR